MISGREMVQHELANWFGDEFQKLDISVRYNLLYNVAMLVRNGFGDALCIRLDCQYPGLRFVPLHPPLAFGSVLVWKKHQVGLPCGQRSDCARKEMPVRHFGTYRIGIRHGSGSCDTMGMSSKGHPFF